MGVLAEGSEFAGYQIRGVVGEGAMGTVYRAFDPTLEREIALKVIDEKLARDQSFRHRFLQEARAAARIDHSSIVTVHQVGEFEGTPYIAMRLVRGPDLATYLGANGPLSVEKAVALLRPVAAGLDAANAAGIVHRDVKPANILVPDDGSDPVLVDFGIGRVMQATRATQTGSWVGTVDYVAPEQIQGGDVDGRADQYALACVLFEAVEGSPPFSRPDAIQTLFAHASEAAPELSRSQDSRATDALAKALSKQPEGRFESCREMVAAAAGTGRTGTVIGTGVGPASGAAADAPPRDHQTSSSPQRTSAGTSTTRRRTGLILGVIGVVLLVVGLGIAVLVIRSGDSGDSVAAPVEPLISEKAPESAAANDQCQWAVDKVRAVVRDIEDLGVGYGALKPRAGTMAEDLSGVVDLASEQSTVRAASRQLTVCLAERPDAHSAVETEALLASTADGLARAERALMVRTRKMYTAACSDVSFGYPREFVQKCAEQGAQGSVTVAIWEPGEVPRNVISDLASVLRQLSALVSDAQFLRAP